MNLSFILRRYLLGLISPIIRTIGRDYDIASEGFVQRELLICLFVLLNGAAYRLVFRVRQFRRPLTRIHRPLPGFMLRHLLSSIAQQPPYSARRHLDLLRLDHRPRQSSLQHEAALERTHEEGLHAQQSNRICHLFAWGSLVRRALRDGCEEVEAEAEDVGREGVC